MDDTNSYLTCVTKNDKYHGDIFRWIRVSKKNMQDQNCIYIKIWRARYVLLKVLIVILMIIFWPGILYFPLMCTSNVWLGYLLLYTPCASMYTYVLVITQC